MLSLFIDTSAQTHIFALLNERQVVSSYFHSAISRSANEPLFIWLQECMKRYEFILSDLDCIAVGCGPGPSFTGIRLGVTMASALAYAHSVPIAGLCSLEIYKPNTDLNIFYTISDARGGELYYVEGKKYFNNYQFTTPKVANTHYWLNKIVRKDIKIISIQYEFFRDIIVENLIPAEINWKYIIKKLSETNTYSDPQLFTIPYFKSPA